LTDTAIEVPDYDGNKSIPVTYVPARNTVFLSIALGWLRRGLYVYKARF